MGIRGRAITGYRDVQVSFSATDTPIDALKAAIFKVEKIEAQYNANNASVVDLTGAALLMSGAQNDFLYLFQVTSDISAGTYAFTFRGLKNADGTDIA